MENYRKERTNTPESEVEIRMRKAPSSLTLFKSSSAFSLSAVAEYHLKLNSNEKIGCVAFNSFDLSHSSKINSRLSNMRSRLGTGRHQDHSKRRCGEIMPGIVGHQLVQRVTHLILHKVVLLLSWNGGFLYHIPIITYCQSFLWISARGELLRHGEWKGRSHQWRD